LLNELQINKEPNGPQSIHCRCKLICTCLLLNVNNNERSERNFRVSAVYHGYANRPAGWKVRIYSPLALAENSAFDAHNIEIYLSNVIFNLCLFT